MPTTFHFVPERVAHFEATGWRAYYDRQWLKMLGLIVALCQEQFHIPFPQSLLAAYYTTRASIAWVPVDHNIEKVRSYLRKFYQVARRYSNLTFDPTRVADLELRYFDVHRRLVGAVDKQEFLDTLIDLHSALFGLSPEQVRESAHFRLLAADTVDGITGHTSTDIEGDWVKLEEYLCQCYTSIQRQLAAKAS
ncbi:MAG: hypothetical protein JOZ18_07865 [Chloroflexi bacterium]|nr:hypothetical protein [Chloroflexota bacterium]